MSQARIVINVRDQEYYHCNGLAGMFTVPAKAINEEFSMLVVYGGSEIQDLGDNRHTQNKDWASATDLARSIIGIGSNAGSREKWGLLLCDAEPDLPRELEKAISEEIVYLNKHIPANRTQKDPETGINVMVNNESEAVSKRKEELSYRVQDLRQEFEKECRKLVTKAEIIRAKRNLLIEDQLLIAQGDQIWAGPEPQRININELHKNACIRLGQERPWCYVARAQQPCPGCGGYIPENVITCKLCGAIFDEAMDAYPKMHPKDRARSLYPERYADPVQASGAPHGKQKP